MRPRQNKKTSTLIHKMITTITTIETVAATALGDVLELIFVSDIKIKHPLCTII
jgi:hypothetical protein